MNKSQVANINEKEVKTAQSKVVIEVEKKKPLQSSNRPLGVMIK